MQCVPSTPSPRASLHVTHSPLLCSESDKARLENENAVEQLDLSSHLVNTHEITELRGSHILELHTNSQFNTSIHAAGNIVRRGIMSSSRTALTRCPKLLWYHPLYGMRFDGSTSLNVLPSNELRSRCGASIGFTPSGAAMVARHGQSHI